MHEAKKRKEIKEEKGGDGATIHTIFHEIMFNCLTSQQETFFSSMLVHPFSFLSSLFFLFLHAFVNQTMWSTYNACVHVSDFSIVNLPGLE